MKASVEKSLNLKTVLIYTILFLSINTIAFSQGVVVTEEVGAVTPHSSSVLDVRATNKGVLIPSLTTSQRLAIPGPANGLLVFDNTENAFYYYNASITQWVSVISSDNEISSGDVGKVAYWNTQTSIDALPYMLLKDNDYVQVTSKSVASDNDPIFEVRNKDGMIVLGVYQTGVRIYVDDSVDKTGRGGFAVGGFTTQKDEKAGIDYLKVTPDSVRIYIENDDTKTGRGGFAVGGFTTQKGMQELFRVTPDSTRIYINDKVTKTGRGGFAVGGFTTQKGYSDNFFNIETGNAYLINPSEARVLWYPLKNAFLAGQVKIADVNDVGLNSMAIGYEAMAKGNRSQAMGYKPEALGENSTAIGKEAKASALNSFAVGEYAQALNEDAYAFGKGALAQGFRSFAFGSSGVDSLNQNTGVAHAIGNYSFAIGQGSRAEGMGAVAIGLADTARGDYSVALGYKTLASGYGSTAAGRESKASGMYAVAMGKEAIASGSYSVALGNNNKATNYNSFAVGGGNTASGQYSSAFGDDNLASGNGSVVMGTRSISQGLYSVAIGAEVESRGESSLAFGVQTVAYAPHSLALGYWVNTYGNHSAAFNRSTYANSAYETVFGRYNVVYTPGSTTTWNNSDHLFVIGNGASYSSQSNALTVLKNGNIGIGNVPNPTSVLQVNATGDKTVNYTGMEFTNVATSTTSFRTKTGLAVMSTGNWTGTGNINRGLYVFVSGGTTNYAAILVGGNVGIGTTAPTETLDVLGNARVRSVGSGTYSSPLNITSTGIFTTATSDARLKDNISTLNNGLEKIMKLRGVSFTWKEEPELGSRIGFVAQEIKEILPELVFTNPTDGFMGVNYAEMSAVLVEAIKEQQQMIENQNQEIERLKSEIETIKSFLSR